MEKMAIRKAVATDFDKIYPLLCWLEDQALNREAMWQCFQLNLQNPDIHLLVAENDMPDLTGFLSLHLQVLLHHCGRTAEIQELVVAPGHQGRGIGKQLLAAAFAIARAQGLQEIEVTPSLSREAAHRFYESTGFLFTHRKYVWKPA